MSEHGPCEFGPWIGRCYFREWLGRPKDDPFVESRFKDYACFAAVWTDSQAGFLDTVTRHLEAQGYAFTWAEDILPIIAWMTRHGYHAEVESLSPRVNAEHRIELGAMTRTGEDGRPLPTVEPLVITRHEIPTLPDQSDVPFWERAWIAPELQELLFGQPDGLEAPLNTYFLVDAALRKNIVGTFDLEAVDVPVKCLFEGEGSEAQKASAPYLIDLTLPDAADGDADLVPRFHKDLFARHWAQETGIVIRTTASFNATWRHCQAHLKVPVEGETRQLFLRYWHPETLDTLLPVLERGDAYQLLRDTHLIYPRESEVIHAHLNPELELEAFVEKQPFTLKAAYLEAFQRLIERRFIAGVEKKLLSALPHTDQEVRQRVSDTVPSMLRYIRERSGGAPVAFGGCFELSLLVLLLGPAAQELLAAPLLNERLVPVEQRIALAREWYLETLIYHMEKGA
ncbi:DUF4123 domain-containing protein [Billgrantia sp. Q4P2]|uniref:DUF4123 domain-containing protein n=1 Tax=Billgrantia sp. Q4P2 TaxID=3463857 RepID=UPI004056B77B